MHNYFKDFSRFSFTLCK